MTEKPKNAVATPMTYEVRRMPNPTLQRQIAAREAAGMTVAELEEAAEEIGVDLTGAETRSAKVEKVQRAGRTR